MQNSPNTDQLQHAFSERVQHVRDALEQSRQERRRFYDAERTRQLFEREIREAEQEAQQMGPLAARTLLEENSESEMQALRERALELRDLISDRKKRLGDLHTILEGEDAPTAERLSIARAQHVADEEIRAARRERDQLVEVLDQALDELNEEAKEASAIRPTFERQEAS